MKQYKQPKIKIKLMEEQDIITGSNETELLPWTWEDGNQF